MTNCDVAMARTPNDQSLVELWRPWLKVKNPTLTIPPVEDRDANSVVPMELLA